MRRLAITLLIASFAAAFWSSVSSSPAQAGDTGKASDLAPVDVLQVSGLFDKVVVDSIVQAIERSESTGAEALILQLNSTGAVVSRAEMAALLQRVADAKVAVGVWVGPARSARAYGLPAQLFAVADVTAMVPGSRLGYSGAPLSLEDGPTDFGAASATLATGSMSFTEARAQGVLRLDISDQGVPTVRNMVLAMDGATVDGRVLNTVVDELQPDGSTQKVSATVRFSGLDLLDELMHTVASPAMAYLLFIIGVALLIFEFFTAGVGIAGVVGAVCAVFGCFGLAALPTRGLAVALLVVAMLAFAIDVQVGIPRFWTGVGVVLFAIGSWFLYRPLPGNDLRLSWITLVVGIGGIALTFVAGMPSMVRTRFATPTVGREWMIGQTGTAASEISPEGIALVGAARWRARTNRATPIAAGAELRVAAIDGVTLEVEPLDGAARDYRERRAKS